MRDPNQMSHGQYLDVAAWQRAWQREFLPFKLYIVIGAFVAALSMGTLCAGWFTMLLLDMDRERILTELTGTTYWTYWQARHSPALAAQAGAIWQGGLLGYGVCLLAWSVFPILCFRPTLKRHEILVAERDPIPLPDPTIRVPPSLQRNYDLYRPYQPSTGKLITVGKPATPDRLHDLNLLRMMRIANERTLRELGPLPPGGLPVQVKGKAPHLRPHWQQELIRQQEQQATPHADGNRTEHEESDEMNLKQMAGAALVVGALAACTPSKPVYRHNPHPQERYEITMMIANAPGPFADLDGGAIYNAPNCTYFAEPVMGAGISHPSAEELIQFLQVSENTWKSTFYTDQMLDEDYDMGDGICRWELQSAGVALRATGAPGEAIFGIALRTEDVRAEKSVTTYFNKRSYPREIDIESYRVPGDVDRAGFGPSITDTDLFTITLSAKKVSP